MTRSLGVTVAISVLLAFGAPAAATPLDEARAAIGASDYLKARAALDEALESGTYARDELAEIYLLRGTVAAALGETPVAIDAFQRALALAPKLGLPAGTSPKITQPFAAAQARATRSGPLAIRAESDAGAVTLIIVADPMSMIAKARVSVSVDGKPEETFERPGAPRASIALPPGTRLDVRIAVVDQHGNRLAELGSREVPIVVLGREAAPRPSDPPRTPSSPPDTGEGAGAGVAGRTLSPSVPSRPIYLKWWLYGSAAIAAGGAATYFGVSTLRARDEVDELGRSSETYTYAEVKSVEDRARRNALLTNISLGAAGALAVTGAILYFTERRAPRRETRARVDLRPTAGGAAVIFGGHF